jgi:preprotein translocase subunit SecB
MKLSPLQMERCYFRGVSISSNPIAKDEDLNRIDLDIEVSTIPDKQHPRQWLVFLDLKIKPQEGVIAPYSGEISVMGRFTVEDNWPENQMERLVYINGAGLLYCSSRELISTITAKGFFDALCLPSWSFFEMYKDLEARRKREAQPELIPKPTPPSDSPPPSAP